MEQWADIQDYEGMYQVSTTGCIRSLNYKRTKQIRLLKGTVMPNGYIQYDLYKNNRRKHEYAHRLVAMAFIPNPNGFDQVNHLNSVRNDNRVENLEWIDPAGNSAHAAMNERFNPKAGMDHPKARLSEHDVQTIRAMNNGGHTQKSIASLFGLSQCHISRVCNRKRWRSV